MLDNVKDMRYTVIIYKECARDKPVDRTPTRRKERVVMLGR